MKIQDKINKEIVFAETDLQVLNDYLLDIDFEIVAIKNKLTEVKAASYEGYFIKPKEFAKMKIELRNLGMIRQVVQRQLSKIKNEIPRFCYNCYKELKNEHQTNTNRSHN